MFGYEADHYQVGLECGERVLLPAVRTAADDQLIVTDGFSCREMIRQETDRHALHFAQVLQMAIKDGPNGPSGRLPEKQYAEVKGAPRVLAALIAGAAAAAAIGVFWGLRRKA